MSQRGNRKAKIIFSQVSKSKKILQILQYLEKNENLSSFLFSYFLTCKHFIFNFSMAKVLDIFMGSL